MDEEEEERESSAVRSTDIAGEEGAMRRVAECDAGDGQVLVDGKCETKGAGMYGEGERGGRREARWQQGQTRRRADG
jgi:hypothetical protein